MPPFSLLWAVYHILCRLCLHHPLQKHGNRLRRKLIYQQSNIQFELCRRLLQDEIKQTWECAGGELPIICSHKSKCIFFALHLEILSISSSWLQRSCNATWAVGLSFSNDICQGTSVEYRVPTDICTAQLPDQKYWYIVRYHNKAPSASGGVVVYVYMGAAAAVILSMMIY